MVSSADTCPCFTSRYSSSKIDSWFMLANAAAGRARTASAARTRSVRRRVKGIRGQPTPPGCRSFAPLADWNLARGDRGAGDRLHELGAPGARRGQRLAGGAEAGGVDRHRVADVPERRRAGRLEL